MAGFACCVWWLLLGVLLGWLLNWLFDKFFRRGGGNDQGRNAYSAPPNMTPPAPRPAPVAAPAAPAAAPYVAPVAASLAATVAPAPVAAVAVPAVAAASAASLASAAAAFGFGKLKSANGYDNFEIIEGIGPKINDVMHNAGVHTFAALGNMDIQAISTILDAAGPNFKLANPQTWAQQASLCASGQWEKLKGWQDELVAGVAISKDNG